MSAYKMMLRSPALRCACIVLFLEAFSYTNVTAYLSTWAIESLSLEAGNVSIVIIMMGISGLILNPIVGLITDRFRAYKHAVLVLEIMTIISYVGIFLVRSLPVAIPFLLMLGIGIIGQLMAMVSVHMESNGYTKEQIGDAMAIIRQFWSLSGIFAPLLSSAVLTFIEEIRYIFLMSIAFSTLAVITLLIGFKSFDCDLEKIQRKKRGGLAGLKDSGIGRFMFMLALAVAVVLIWQPAQTRTTYMPLLLTEEIGLPASRIGPLLTASAAGMVIFFTFMGRWVTKMGAYQSLFVSGGVGLIYCILQSQPFTNTYLSQFLLQVMLAFASAMWNTGTILFFEECLPDSKGLADGFFASVRQAPPLVVGMLVGPAAEKFGIRGVFRASSMYVICGMVLTFILVSADRYLKKKRLQSMEG